MLSLIEVQCPHCGARGQIMVPPVGAIIIGPCPQCDELVVVFCGHVLPLEKQLMESGSIDEKREHLLGVLTEFLQDRIYKLLTEEEAEGAETGDVQEEAKASGQEPGQLSDDQKREGAMSPISQTEFDRFTTVDLKLLDNRAYFKSVFEEN